MAVYQDQLKAGLRLPLHNLFYDIINYWAIDIGQIAPNGIRTAVAFILICKCFGVPTSLELFSKFFNVKHIKDGLSWHTFYKKRGARNLIAKLPQSIYGWKGQWFFCGKGRAKKTVE